ncbi:hypothetical protein PO909_011784 [Leuciscus waleckii]
MTESGACVVNVARLGGQARPEKPAFSPESSDIAPAVCARESACGLCSLQSIKGGGVEGLILWKEKPHDRELIVQPDTSNLRVYYGLFYGGVKPSSILMSCDSPCSSGNRIYNYLLFFGGTGAVFFFPSALIASVRNTHKSQPRTLWPAWTNLKMQRAATASVTQSTTTQNTTAATKSRDQILTQSSGAMIAIIVIGIIIILTFLLIVLKTYNRRTHAKRMMAGGSSKPRKKVSSTTTNTNMAMSNVGANSVSGSFAQSNASSDNGFRIPRVELGNMERSNGEHLSTNSGSTIVTIHDMPSVDNT